MNMKIETLKKPASILGALILIFIGAYIMMSSQVSIGKKDGSPAKEVPKATRITVGIIVLLIGVIIFYPHFFKKQD